MEKISVVIITLNEEANLPRCLESVAGLADEVLVVDSLSTDDTVAIAEAAGAKVISQPFLGHREQKAFAIAVARNEYVLSIDADEALSDELRESIRSVLDNWTHDCYFMNRLNRFMGAWIRHGGWYPDRKMRLFDRRKYVLGGINPHDSFDPVEGATSTQLQGDLLHYTDEGFHDRYNRLNKHSTIAAKAYYERGKRGNLARLITKPPARFVSKYLFKLGFLDGLPGYFIARTDAHYVFMREAKLRAHSGEKGGGN
ncbi:glycosyltransferase family 2 protein [Lewinella sp. 4G2]|uniref:glycosyltransferase family 2 protein n=1 Tax=Lewinella sp. 4G2 TaxID=1803372 RepID=UPI0007B45F16|nr:glycosyltransferase family 2 protein [Lewinella sp. 4G2]OAV44897.1 hypothetical protein A3850_010510 [Lewinella sp. 4G2]